MNDNDPSSEKHPLRFAIAMVAALTVNVAIGAAVLHSGIDDRLLREGVVATPPHIVADLGTLPAVIVSTCRAKV